MIFTNINYAVNVSIKTLIDFMTSEAYHLNCMEFLKKKKNILQNTKFAFGYFLRVQLLTVNCLSLKIKMLYP